MQGRSILLWLTALSLIAGGCGGPALDQEQAAADIGADLALMLTEPLLRASAADGASETTEAIGHIEETMTKAVRDLSMPEGVADVIAGPKAATQVGDGYASVSTALAVIPEAEGESGFCMVFAVGTDGTVVAQPAPGDPINRCRDTELVDLPGF
jgi:hypothetical protein